MKIRLLIALFFAASIANSQVKIGIETGALFTGYNDVRIPGEGGTNFSLSKELEGDPFFFYRINVTYTFKSKHNFSLLYAPLKTTYKGAIGREIHFVNTVFAPDTDLKAIYKFNSYRLTYRYDFVVRPKMELGFGLTAKIRDAKISLESLSAADESTNVGIVPIINFRLMWHYSDKLGVLLQGDAVVAPQGRAEDVLLAATYKPSRKLQLHLGYRILEGGSDGKSVYTFSSFNYAALGASYVISK